MAMGVRATMGLMGSRECGAGCPNLFSERRLELACDGLGARRVNEFVPQLALQTRPDGAGAV
eukprot:9107112-Alexandrium_andersonii.AAC.1